MTNDPQMGKVSLVDHEHQLTFSKAMDKLLPFSATCPPLIVIWVLLRVIVCQCYQRREQ
ncbi:MAG: hypothetical protein NW224_21095 [Leptolyngbyaceae cyanobacterium bins.302]|nr:hypothetical protein [Leptolyngbyaceae cyanobacterium bins.302]